MQWLRGIHGNARGCLIYEPMFILPYSLYTTYATVYMLRLGVSTTQIGMVTSLGMILQLFSSAASGQLTDRLGRRRALLLFDLVSWSAATLIWMVSANVWFFVVAALFNSFQKIPNTAWYCLLIEDTEIKERAKVFTALQLILVAAGLFTPLGGLLIAHMKLVPAVRLMYGLAFIGMTSMFFLRNRAVHETAVGVRQMAEARGVTMKTVVRQHAAVIREIFSDRRVVAVFAVYVLNNFQAVLVITFLSVYLVSDLDIKAAWIALFPAIASVVTLLLVYLVVPRLPQHHAERHVAVGFLLSFVGSLLLITAPRQAIAYVAVTAILSAAGAVIANPFLEALTANVIRDEERAKFTSVLTVLILLFTWPAGLIGGFVYAQNPRLTFAVVACVLLIGAAIVLTARGMRVREA